MHRIKPMRWASVRVASDRAAARAFQFASYAAAPAVLILALQGLARSQATRPEMLIGVLAAGALAVGLVSLGTATALFGEVRGH